MVKLFEKFIRDSRGGKRMQPNGKKISSGTVDNYQACLNLLKKYNQLLADDLRIRAVKRLNARELVAETKYWQKFYKGFTKWMYDSQGYFDNYAGMIIKTVKIFFNYLNRELTLGVGDFHKSFYVRHETIAIFPLQPEELKFLIHDKEFECILNRRLREAKDFFVFGCTVALRFSDLKALRPTNLKLVNGSYYLAVHSIKTGSDSLVKLPDYALEILKKYRKNRTRLLPSFNLTNMNAYVKILLEKAGLTQKVMYTRSRRGIQIIRQKEEGKIARFCDVATTHTMRRTAITTMLRLGMPEQLVRKISGHSPSSKEFYKYIAWAQTYQDLEAEKVFASLAK